MNVSILNKHKKKFLKWFTKNYVLKRRESLWILDYLYNHDLILEKTHIVEHVEKSPRGIYMSVTGNSKPAFRFYKNNQTFKEPMQAFHEVRLNWSSPLYLEIDFDESWNSPEYLRVLEDNPDAKWNDMISEEFTQKISNSLNYETLLHGRKLLLEKINHTLTTGDKEKFAMLVNKLNQIDEEINYQTSIK